MAIGRRLSMQPMSIENRFRIRPEGLLLKKTIDDRMMPRKSLSCSVIDARRHILKKEKERVSVKTSARRIEEL